MRTKKRVSDSLEAVILERRPASRPRSLRSFRGVEKLVSLILPRRRFLRSKPCLN